MDYYCAYQVVLHHFNLYFLFLLTLLRGERFAFGHHYFRPHETHHSPSRRFYQNELFRMPLYEIVPLESVVATCCVLDLYTYCKGEGKHVCELTHEWSSFNNYRLGFLVAPVELCEL